MPFPNSSFALAGKYTQIHVIGHGSGGKVYRAVDNLGRVVAVKEALPSHAGFIDTQERFEKEARIQAILKHPKIIHVYHLEEEPQTHELYLICEYANGGPLSDHLKAYGPLPEHEAVRIALDICAALDEVSGKRFVHRDVKPSTILLFKDDQGQITEAKLGDFGVAKDLDQQRQGQLSTQRGSSHPGTPEYMAPEQADITKPVDVRTDLYAFGISLWEMLTGTDYKLLAAPAGPPVLRTHSPQTSLGIAEVIQRAVEHEPADRYPTARAMSADLQAVLSGRSFGAAPTIVLHSQTPPRRAGVGCMRAVVLVLGLVLALVGYGAWRRNGLTPAPTPTAASVSSQIQAPVAASTPTPWHYERECENPDQGTVGMLILRSDASGSRVHGQFGSTPDDPYSPEAGYVLYTNITIPQIDHLSLQLRYSKNSPSSAPILIFIDNEATPRATFYPIDHGDWNRFDVTQPIDLGSIGSGTHAIKFSTAGQQYGVADLDKFVLDESAPPSSAAIAVTSTVPETVVATSTAPTDMPTNTPMVAPAATPTPTLLMTTILTFTSLTNPAAGRQSIPLRLGQPGRYMLVLTQANPTQANPPEPFWMIWDYIGLKEGNTWLWEIGESEAPPDYTEAAFSEFCRTDKRSNCTSEFFVGTTNVGDFADDINAIDRPRAVITFTITDQQANTTPTLVLSTLYASHDSIEKFALTVTLVRAP